MTRIPENERDLMEKAIYLPMVITILNRDLQIVENSPFKLKSPYVHWVTQTLTHVQHEFSEVKWYMKGNRMSVEKINSDDMFTMFLFLYKGYEEKHNYFNPRLRNKVEELMKHYLYDRLLL